MRAMALFAFHPGVNGRIPVARSQYISRLRYSGVRRRWGVPTVLIHKDWLIRGRLKDSGRTRLQRVARHAHMAMAEAIHAILGHVQREGLRMASLCGSDSRPTMNTVLPAGCCSSGLRRRCSARLNCGPRCMPSSWRPPPSINDPKKWPELLSLCFP